MPNLSLNKFMVFNSGEGQNESREQDKLLYHWTKDSDDHQVSITEQIDDICLCDATVNVSTRLNGVIPSQDGGSPTRPGSQSQENDANRSATTNIDLEREGEANKSLILYFDTTLVLIVEVEPGRNIWMAAHVADSSVSDSVSEGSQGAHQPLIQQSNPHSFPTDAIKRVINGIYARFCLLNGTFHMIASEIEQEAQDLELNDEATRARVRDTLRSICRNFFRYLLTEIHLCSILSNLASLYNYILYLDLNPLTLLEVNNFVKQLVRLDATKIRHTIVIFDDKLLWTSMAKYDTRLVYNYLVSSLIKDALQDELSREVDKVRRIAEEMAIYLTDSSANNSELSDPPDKTTEEQTTQDDHIATKSWEKFYMTVFRSSNNLTLGLILSHHGEKDLLDKCEEVLTSDSLVGLIPLASLAQSVGQDFIKANTLNTNPQTNKNQPEQPNSSFLCWNRQAAKITKTPSDQKYILIDKTHASLSWPFSMDIQRKVQLMMSSSDSGTLEYSGSRTFRLIRHLVELEPELSDIERLTSSRVEEFFGKGSNDIWLTISNCKYKSIYSVYKVRNSSLMEAQQSAINLRSILTSNIP